MIEPFHKSNLEALLQIQDLAYGIEFKESRDIWEQRIQSNASLAWKFTIQNQIAAYLWCYQGQLNQITPLNQCYKTTLNPNCLFIHDCAVHPQFQNLKIASQCISHALHSATKLKLDYTVLVSVQNSQSYWERFGFKKALFLSEEQNKALISYGPDAVFMIKNLKSFE